MKMGRYTTTTNTTTSKRNTNTRLLLALAGSIFRLSFASHDIHRRTHTKKTENFTCIHNILCCRTENAQSNTEVKKRRKCFGWHSHGVDWIGVCCCYAGSRIPFLLPVTEKRHFSSIRFYKGIFILSLVANRWPGSPAFYRSSHPASVTRCFYVTQSRMKKFSHFDVIYQLITCYEMAQRFLSINSGRWCVVLFLELESSIRLKMGNFKRDHDRKRVSTELFYRQKQETPLFRKRNYSYMH